MSENISLIDGYNYALDNAILLHEIALKSSGEGGFGIGCSLNILSAEEAIKAVACFSKHFEPNEVEDFDKIFKNHKIKHEGIKSLLNLVKKLNTIGLSELQEIYYTMILDANKLLNDEPSLSKVEIERRFPILKYAIIIAKANEARILINANIIINKIKAIALNMDDM